MRQVFRFSLLACLAIAMVFAVLTPKHASAGPAWMEEDSAAPGINTPLNGQTLNSTTGPVNLWVETDFVEPDETGIIQILFEQVLLSQLRSRL